MQRSRLGLLMNTLAIVILLALTIPGCRSKEKAVSPSSSSAAHSRNGGPQSGTPVTAVSPDHEDSRKWKTIEDFEFDWQQQGKKTRFKLELPEGYEDPGDFTRVTIQSAGNPDFVLDNKDGWVAYNAEGSLSQEFLASHKNLIPSKFVLVLPVSQNHRVLPLVFLISWGYASDTSRLHVIGLDSSGQPRLIFNDNLDLVDVRDLDGDGISEMIGLPCMSEEWGEGFMTYDPIHVYKLPNPASENAGLSLPLTRSYNLKHYYGWAGPECSEDWTVVLHPPGGGPAVVVRKSEAEKMFAESR